jgi:glycerol kinase
MEQFILALDQGTTGTTVCLVDKGGRIRSVVNNEHPQIYPQPGWVEHDPEAIWASVLRGIAEVFKQSSIRPQQIAGIGITNQRETIVLWDPATGKAVHNAIVWQCRRTTEFCQRLKKNKATAKMVRKKTGLVLDPYFSASKMRWLRDNVPAAKSSAQNSDNLKIGTVDSFLLWRLTGGNAHKTDVSNASRTMLMNISNGTWDADLLKLFKVPKSWLPEIAPSNSTFGVTAGVEGLPDGLPICGIAGDQQSALFGQMCFSAGEAKCTFGTGSFLLMNTGAKMVHSKAGLLTTVAWQLKGEKKLTYALEGGAFICGAAVQWLRDEMEFFSSSAEIEKLAVQVDSTDGVYLIPAFVGLGAPYWDPDARGALVGLTRGSNRSHVARATLEAMALQNVDILQAMQKDLGRKLLLVKVDGGAAKNDLLMQMQADFLGTRVLRPKQIESTVLGAAYLAGLGVGFWSTTKELQKIWLADREFAAQLAPKSRTKKLEDWHTAVERVR